MSFPPDEKKKKKEKKDRNYNKLPRGKDFFSPKFILCGAIKLCFDESHPVNRILM